MSRHIGPHMLPDNDSQFFQTFNRNKRSITLDLKHPDGQAVLRALAGTADAVMNNLRGDQPDKLGLTHVALGSLKPGLVVLDGKLIEAPVVRSMRRILAIAEGAGA